MTAKIHNALNRIILLLIAAGVILWPVYSAACDESYDAVRGISEYQNELGTPSLPAVSDLIANSSSSPDLTRYMSERGRSGRQPADSLDDTVLTGFRSCDIHSVNLSIYLLCVLLCTSFKHISYIHLKDGNK